MYAIGLLDDVVPEIVCKFLIGDVENYLSERSMRTFAFNISGSSCF